MDQSDLRSLAKRLNIDPANIITWRAGFRKMNPLGKGRPKGKLYRPNGWISVGDALRKYRLEREMLTKWREQGLPLRRGSGKMILINEPALRAFIERSRKDVGLK